MECANLAVWLGVGLYAELGGGVQDRIQDALGGRGDDDSLLERRYDFFDEDNSPLKFALHFEDGRQVDACTWKPAGESGSPDAADGAGTSDATTSPAGSWKDTYAAVLDQNPSAQYALAEMSGDEVPELILQGESAGNGSLRLYLVYYVDPGGDQSTALLAGGHLYAGVAQVGGYRGVLAAASGQPGVYCTEW